MILHHPAAQQRYEHDRLAQGEEEREGRDEARRYIFIN